MTHPFHNLMGYDGKELHTKHSKATLIMCICLIVFGFILVVVFIILYEMEKMPFKNYIRKNGPAGMAPLTTKQPIPIPPDVLAKAERIINKGKDPTAPAPTT